MIITVTLIMEVFVVHWVIFMLTDHNRYNIVIKICIFFIDCKVRVSSS